MWLTTVWDGTQWRAAYGVPDDESDVFITHTGSWVDPITGETPNPEEILTEYTVQVLAGALFHDLTLGGDRGQQRVLTEDSVMDFNGTLKVNPRGLFDFRRSVFRMRPGAVVEGVLHFTDSVLHLEGREVRGELVLAGTNTINLATTLRLSQPITIPAGSTLNIVTHRDKTCEGIITNHGAIRFLGTGRVYASSFVVINEPDGIVEIDIPGADTSPFWDFNASRVINRGTLRKTSASPLARVNARRQPRFSWPTASSTAAWRWRSQMLTGQPWARCCRRFATTGVRAPSPAWRRWRARRG